MGLNIDFNNPKILQAYKELALPKAGLEESTDRIIVGGGGGLVYTLFQGELKGFPTKFEANSLSEMGVVQDYFNAVQTYLTNAGKHAEQHGFRLIRIGSRDILYDCFNPEGLIYNASLGSMDIESVERFEEFLEMVKSGKGELDKQYEVVFEKSRLVSHIGQ